MTICAFGGSSLWKKKKSYHDAAINLAKELVLNNIDLVYGGGNVGLMGLISQTIFDGGRHVLSVIPKALMGKEITSVTIGEEKPVKNFEVITWAKLGIHVRITKHDCFYNSLLTFIKQVVEEGFIKLSAHHIIISSSNAKKLIEKLEDYYPCHEQVALN
ncbi:LOG family protein [Dioscorea alata]|uniref:LOG family protein n=1 Tax=Dioscorea alata TaxID=55571 RepID=A0ACB7V1R7_DIOAL|nr:LOG family protein [Dioscorea alata]